MRATNNPATKKRHKKLLKQAKGYQHARRKNFRQAKETVQRAGQFAYRDRRRKKRDFRRLWVSRISAAARQNGLTYSRLMHGLRVAEVDLNRKMLADLAVTDPEAFARIAEVASEAA